MRFPKTRSPAPLRDMVLAAGGGTRFHVTEPCRSPVTIGKSTAHIRALASGWTSSCTIEQIRANGYPPTAEGFVYLAVVLDLFSRKVVGWALSDSLATSVVSQALRKAIENRHPKTSELLVHSDRGCQYTSDEYQRVLRTLQITCSMSRTACCYDNAVMERFF